MDSNPGATGFTRQGQAIAALHRAQFRPVKRGHLPYCHRVAEAIAAAGDAPIAGYANGRTSRWRSFVAWLGQGFGPIQLIWAETAGWAIAGLPALGERPWYAALDRIAEPEAVATWISEATWGRAAGGLEPPTRRRAPTKLETATDEDLKFEQRLAGFGGGMAPVMLEPVEPKPRQAAYGWTWDHHFRQHYCLTCTVITPDTPLQDWSREASALAERVAFTPHDEAVTGWCQFCIPVASPRREKRLNARLITWQETGQLPGALPASRKKDLRLCPCCLDPWIQIPTTTTPLTTGVWSEVGLWVHPCPWCWHTSEPEARQAQERALSHPWGGW